MGLNVAEDGSCDLINVYRGSSDGPIAPADIPKPIMSTNCGSSIS